MKDGQAQPVKVIPRIEIVLHPTDSRPIVAWANEDFDQTGEVFFSPGSTLDILELKWWLDWIGNAAADEWFDRNKLQERTDDILDGSSPVDTSDLPF